MSLTDLMGTGNRLSERTIMDEDIKFLLSKGTKGSELKLYNSQTGSIIYFEKTAFAIRRKKPELKI